MTRVWKVPLFLILCGVAASIALAQQAENPPTIDEIVQALNPNTAAQFRSLKGIKIVPGQTQPAPSIDLTVNFAFDSAKLETETLLTLKRLGTALQDPRLANFKFAIAGHTDSKGTDDYNLKLSAARANAVRSHLIFFYNVTPARLTAIGYGKLRLLMPEDPENGANRRVQIINQGPTS